MRSALLALGFVLSGEAWAQEPDNKAKAPAIKEPALGRELMAMVKEDQDVRALVLKDLGAKGVSVLNNKVITDPALLKFVLETQKKMADVDKKNQKRLRQIVDKYGWPGKSLVGADGANAAFLLVQHSDSSLAFQKRCLGLMKAAAKGEVEPKEIAYLTDRVRIAEKKKQLYGTQLVGQGGVFKPHPIEDAANVDKRRAELGLPPLADYLKMAQAEYEKLSGK